MPITKYLKSVTSSHKRHSEYTGVQWNSQAQKWEATVTDKRIRYGCGLFDNDRDAAKARDRKIIALGLNKPLQILKRL